ncbi:hypothetical protein N665_0037s0024 [Sinapis alba]|nr:hypothetical protein N665_0037s0024 [Sinapis alba]
MDLPEVPKRLFTLGEEPEPVKSISYHTDDTKLFTAIRGALHLDEYHELRDSKLGVFLKFKELNFAWASRLVHFMLCFKVDIKKKYELWCLVGPEPVRFSLIEFEHLTGLNCDYVENLENPRCKVTEETFWQLLGVGIDAGPTTEQIIASCKRCLKWSRDDRMRLGYLAIFTGFIEGRKFSIVTRASLARLVMDLEEFENYPWGRVACGCTNALPEFGAEYGHPIQNKPSPPLLAYNGGKGRRFFKDAIRRQSVVMNFLKKKDINEMWPKWDHDVEDKAADHIVEVMWNGNHHWTMECWEVAGTTLGSNQKFVVVYAKNEERYVKEETTVKEARPRKKARKETTVKAEESPREAEETPREAGEAPVGWITQEVFENGMKQMDDAMRDGFGMILREIKHVADGSKLFPKGSKLWSSLPKAPKGLFLMRLLTPLLNSLNAQTNSGRLTQEDFMEVVW